MSKRKYDSDDDRADVWDDDSNDNEFEDFDDSESEMIACPACGADVFEDAEMCPVCGEYITSSTSPWLGKSFWWIVLGLAGIIAVIIFSLPAIS